jgi:YesN/AraC family two-component response regulator
MGTAFRPHVLVVDDDATVRDALLAALTDGYAVHPAATGTEGQACLRAHPVAVIILDAILREEHGLDLVAPFRTIRAVPIVLLTGHSSEELAIRAVRHHVADYLTKPVSLPELLATVGRLVPYAASPADLAARVRQALDLYPPVPFCYTTLALQLHMSESHIRRAFRAAYGATPHQYLRTLRLQRAATLLRTSSCGVKEIAFTVGFPDVPWFTRCFTRAFGVPPAAWRAGGSGSSRASR